MQSRPETPDMDMNGRGDPFNAPVPGQSNYRTRKCTA